MAVKFLRYAVRNEATGEKARVIYSLDNRTDGRKCVTMYARDYTGALGRVFGDEYRNESDAMTDYFEAGKAVLFEGHPLYKAARGKVHNYLANAA